MCKFCDSLALEKKMPGAVKQRVVLEVEIHGADGFLGYSLGRERFDLNYCPECGKKLVSGEGKLEKCKHADKCGVWKSCAKGSIIKDTCPFINEKKVDAKKFEDVTCEYICEEEGGNNA